MRQAEIRSLTHFCASVWLPAEPSAVFEFHSDPRNIGLISPPFQRIIRVEALPAEPGATFFIEIQCLGIPMKWLGRWERVEPGALLVDVALESPFAFWEHQHRFEAVSGGTRMTDEVLCSTTERDTPMHKIGTRAVLTAMFASRHARTRRYWENLRR